MTRKTGLFEGWSWFKFNNFGLTLHTNLKFYTSLSKGLKLKVRKFWGLTPTFVEVTGEKLVGGTFLPPPPPILNRVNVWECYNSNAAVIKEWYNSKIRLSINFMKDNLFYKIWHAVKQLWEQKKILCKGENNYWCYWEWRH